MKKRRFDPKEDPYYNLNSTSSATECTGIAPAGLQNEEESENIAQLYSIHSAKNIRQE